MELKELYVREVRALIASATGTDRVTAEVRGEHLSLCVRIPRSEIGPGLTRLLVSVSKAW